MARRDRSEILATTVDGTGLSRRDLGTLLPQVGLGDHKDGWLNDEIVNAWISAIVERKNEKHNIKRGQVPKYASYATAWYTNYKDKGIKGIETWSRRKQIKGEKLLDCELILFPVNTGAHWMLLIIEPKRRMRISFFDSMQQASKKRQFMGIAREWLKMELKDKYVESDWEESTEESVAQLNQNDCGVYVALNALIAAKGGWYYHELEHVSMEQARRLMTAILLHGGFRGDWEL